MAKKEITKDEPKGNKPDKDVEKRLKPKKTVPAFQPNTTENVASKYVKRRTAEMIKFRQQLKIEGTQSEYHS